MLVCHQMPGCPHIPKQTLTVSLPWEVKGVVEWQVIGKTSFEMLVCESQVGFHSFINKISCQL